MFAKLLALLVLTSLAATQKQEMGVERFLTSGYIHAPGLGYYRLIPYEKEIWPEARRRCQEEGAELFVVNSIEEANFIRELVYGNGTEFGTVNIDPSDFQILHSGFHDLFIEGEYLTIRSEPLITTGFVHWLEEHPIGDSSFNCGAYDINGYILDINCYIKLPWICEMPENNTTTCNC